MPDRGSVQQLTTGVPDLESEKELLLSQPDEKANLGLSIFNLACAAIGGGVLGFPYAYKSTGLIAGLLLTFFLLFFMVRSLQIIGNVTLRFHEDTYQGIVISLFGPRWARFAEVITVIYLFGACVAYMSIVGDTLTVTLDHWFGDSISKSMPFVHDYLRQFVIVFFSLVIIFPLSCLRRLDWLGPVSILAVGAVVYLFGLVVYTGIDALAQHPVPVEDLKISSNFFCWSADHFVCIPVSRASSRCFRLSA